MGGVNVVRGKPDRWITMSGESSVKDDRRCRMHLRVDADESFQSETELTLENHAYVAGKGSRVGHQNMECSLALLCCVETHTACFTVPIDG